MADHKDFTSEERNAQNQRLMQGLHEIYGTPSKDAQSLARVRERFLATASQDALHPTQGTRTQQGRVNGTHGGTPTRHRPGQWRPFSTIAAVLFVTLLISSFIALFDLHQRGNGTPAKGTTPARAAVAEYVGDIWYIHMIDAATGWALPYQAVLRTTDGGTHWQDVTPPRYHAQLGCPVPIPGVRISHTTATFLTATTGWVAVGPPGAPDITVFRTFNAGQTWQESTIHHTSHAIECVAGITFINTQDGWIMASLSGTPGPGEDIVILHTTDGGATWTIASRTNPQGESMPGALPYAGVKTGLSFLDASTGWITGSDAQNHIPWLYVSHDGGRTWQQQSLQLPPNQATTRLVLGPPTFFNATDGVLPVSGFTIAGKNPPVEGIVIYVTHDGGRTWHGTTLLADSGDADLDFVDLNHGWVQSYTGLYMTSDAGQHWTKITSAALALAFPFLDFVSNEIGWAIVTSYSGSWQASLYKTEDGGHTWKRVIYTVLKIPR